MFKFFGKGSGGEPDLTSLNGIKALIKDRGLEGAWPIINEAADSGNLTCQTFMWNAALAIPEQRRPSHIQASFEKYTEMGAENGDPQAQYNWAQVLIKRIEMDDDDMMSLEDFELIREAKDWYRSSAKHGYSPSIIALKELECFDC